MLEPTQNVGVGPVGVMVKVTVTGEVVVLVNAAPVMLPEPLEAIPVTALVLSLVHAKVVPVTLLLVPSVIVVNEAPEQIVWLLLVAVAAGTALTVTVVLLLAEHPVAVVVSVKV